jgi:hypothetical protein
MAKATCGELTPCFDVDVITLLVLHATPIRKVTEESGRIALWFDAPAVAEMENRFVSGKAMVDAQKWSATVRRLHQSYFSPSAKSAIRSKSGRGLSLVDD